MTGIRIGLSHLCRGRAFVAMRRNSLHLSFGLLLTFAVVAPSAILAFILPARESIAKSTSMEKISAPDIDVTGGVEGTTLIAEVNYSDNVAAAASRCWWVTTVISTPRYEPYSFMTRNGTKYRWYMRTCPAPSDTPGAPVQSFHWVPVLTETTLAMQASAYSWTSLPVPYVGTAPPALVNVVNLPTWWWVTRSSWRKVSTTAWIPTPRGPLIVTVTANPKELLVNPGDPDSPNNGRFTCKGPGDAWSPQDGDDAKSACMYTYRHSSSREKLNASVAIRWSITWSSNVGKRGTLPSVTTTRRIPVVVGEIQALVAN